MLLHIIFEWSGFDSNSKRFKNQLENEFGNCFGKRKAKFHFSLSLPHFRPAGPFFSTGLPDFLFLPSLTSLLFQAEAQPNTDATLSPPFGRASPA
jgi:hypothetical protein